MNRELGHANADTKDGSGRLKPGPKELGKPMANLIAGLSNELLASPGLCCTRGKYNLFEKDRPVEYWVLLAIMSARRQPPVGVYELHENHGACEDRERERQRDAWHYISDTCSLSDPDTCFLLAD